MVHMLCMTPDLLDKVQFTVELWQKQHFDTHCVAGHLKDRFNLLEVRLVVKELATAASGFTRRTMESLAFSLQYRFGLKSSLPNNLGHSLEPAHLLMPIRKV